MRIIEPCCAVKHLLELRNAIGKNGQTFFEGYGDLSLAEFLPALLTRYSETRMLLAAPSLPEQAVVALRRRMRQQWARMDGRGKLNNIQHLDIITDVAASPALQQLLDDSLVSDRLTVHDVKQEDYVILLPDIAILNFKNLQYSEHFIATVSTRKEYVEELWTKYLLLASAPAPKEKEEPEKKKGGKRKKAAVEDAQEEAHAEEVPGDATHEEPAAVAVAKEDVSDEKPSDSATEEMPSPEKVMEADDAWAGKKDEHVADAADKEVQASVSDESDSAGEDAAD